MHYGMQTIGASYQRSSADSIINLSGTKSWATGLYVSIRLEGLSGTGVRRHERTTHVLLLLLPRKEMRITRKKAFHGINIDYVPG